MPEVVLPDAIDAQLVGHYWDYNGTNDLELEATGEYRFIGINGTSTQRGTWRADGTTVYFDGKACGYTLGVDDLGSEKLAIDCGDGSVVDRNWYRRE